MYCQFFGFTEKPFTITPDPRYVFLSRCHREAFARLLYGVESRAGFIAMTGEIGTGKTTLLRTLLGQLDAERYSSALIFNPCLTGDQLLACICRELDLKTEEATRFGYLEILNRFLLSEHAAGRTVVLVIDEAQNLAPDVLEQVRLISNLETEQDKLIQIILAGQPELNQVLARYDLRQLDQRITVRCHLKPMGLRETTEYISHRLMVSGGRIPGLFSKGAVKRIFRYSGGFPRLINVVCEQALVLAWTRESLAVTPAMVGEVLTTCPRPAGTPGFWNRLLGWIRIGGGR